MGCIKTACEPVLIRLGYRFMVMDMSSLVERFSRGCRRQGPWLSVTLGAPAMDYDMIVDGIKDPGRAFLSGRQL